MKASDRKASILASAAPIFNRNGFAGTSINDILDAARLEKGGLYNHFASKEELAAASFDYAFGLVRVYFTEATCGVESGAPHFRAYVDAFAKYIDRPAISGGCPLVNAALEADDSVPFLRRRVHGAFQEIREALARQAHRAIQKGHYRSDADAQAIADFVLATLEGALILRRGTRDRQASQRILGTLRAWLTGLERR